jgi:NAD(P)-dependent dehydrogenase (short-subunit alcohol dehydrogenase family)
LVRWRTERLAQRAVDRFGRIDVWVNAGVIAYGRFDDVPAEDFRRVLETDLFGQVHGARAAIPRFRAHGTGVLITMSSVWGRVELPYVSAYVTSKLAVRALSETLRFELRDCPDVHVATVLPQAVDTPIFDHAANDAGRMVRPIPLLEDPETVAEGICSAPYHPSATSRTAAPVAASSWCAPSRHASTAACRPDVHRGQLRRRAGGRAPRQPVRADARAGVRRLEERSSAVLRRAVAGADRGLLRRLRAQPSTRP